MNRISMTLVFLTMFMLADYANGQQAWQSYDKEDPITGFNNRYMYMDNTVSGRDGRLDSVRIVAACRNDKTSVWVDWDWAEDWDEMSFLYFMTNYESVTGWRIYQSVTYRIDRTPAVTESQHFSVAHYASFFQRPIEFLRRIADANRLVVGIGNTRAVTFDMYSEDTKSEIAILSTRCHWSFDP